jgi:rifampin ADP-ribosylating transferase
VRDSPKPFEPHESSAFLHGTKADFSVGDLLVSGHRMNYDAGRYANHVYVTQTLDAATWGAELAVGDGRGRIYIVEPPSLSTWVEASAPPCPLCLLAHARDRGVRAS